MSSRRDFLKTVILSSGAVFSGLPLGCGDSKVKPNQDFQKLVATIPELSQRSLLFERAHKFLRESKNVSITPGNTIECDVVIVGGGPSGLTAAMYLIKCGYKVIVVENEERAGGAAISGKYKDIAFPLASIYFVDFNQTIKELCEYAQVTPVQAPVDGLLYRGNKYIDHWKDSVLTTLPLQQKEKDSLKQFRDDILKIKELPLYPLPDRLTKDNIALDAMSVREYCLKYKSEFLNQFVNLYTRSSMGGSIDETNAYCFLNFYASEIGMDVKTPRYTFYGGLNGITGALARKIGNQHFLYGNLCLHLENTSSGVSALTVDVNEHVTKINAKFAVVASQKFMIPSLIPSLPDEQKQAMRQIRYSPYLTVHLCADNDILGDSVFDTWLFDSPLLGTDIIDPQSVGQKSTQGAFVASVYSPRPHNERGALQSSEVVASLSRKIADNVTSQLGKGAKEAVKEIQSFAWGHSLVTAAPKSHNGIAQTARKTFKNIHFANTDNDCSPAFENAVQHGQLAAEAIISKLKNR